MWAKPKKMLLTYADAYNFALDRLAMRDHSSLELRDKLAEEAVIKSFRTGSLRPLGSAILLMMFAVPDMSLMLGEEKASMDEITFGSCLKNGRSRHLS